jgi:hypothetical protein
MCKLNVGLLDVAEGPRITQKINKKDEQEGMQLSLAAYSSLPEIPLPPIEDLMQPVKPQIGRA